MLILAIPANPSSSGRPEYVRLYEASLGPVPAFQISGQVGGVGEPAGIEQAGTGNLGLPFFWGGTLVGLPEGANRTQRRLDCPPKRALAGPGCRCQCPS